MCLITNKGFSKIIFRATILEHSSSAITKHRLGVKVRIVVKTTINSSNKNSNKIVSKNPFKQSEKVVIVRKKGNLKSDSWCKLGWTLCANLLVENRSKTGYCGNSASFTSAVGAYIDIRKTVNDDCDKRLADVQLQSSANCGCCSRPRVWSQSVSWWFDALSHITPAFMTIGRETMG